MGILLDSLGQISFSDVAVRGVEDRPKLFSYLLAHFLAGNMRTNVNEELTVEI